MCQQGVCTGKVIMQSRMVQVLYMEDAHLSIGKVMDYQCGGVKC